MTAESIGIDSENYLFTKLEEYKSDIPNIISRRQFNDRRKQTIVLLSKVREKMVSFIDGGEGMFCIDSKPIEVCRPARAKRSRLGKTHFETAPDMGYRAS